MQQAQQILHLTWSHVKPEFSEKKTEEDAEAQMFRTNNWMNTHQFQEGIKVQRFCLTLIGESRLWYGSLRPINVDWQGLQKSIQAAVFKNRQYVRAIISCMEIISF